MTNLKWVTTLTGSILFGSTCAALPQRVCQHTVAPPTSFPLAASEGRSDGVPSNVVRAQGSDHLGGPLMNIGFALEVLWEPIAPRLYQRLLRLGLMCRRLREGTHFRSSKLTQRTHVSL